MNENEHKIAELEARIDHLVRTQIDFQKEILAIRGALTRLRGESVSTDARSKDRSLYTPLSNAAPQKQPIAPESHEPDESRAVPPPNFGYRYTAPETESGPVAERAFQKRISEYKENARNDFERFIGENLISKVGIIVLIIGVGIGVKYSIDNDLISPLARIVAGYFVGFGLVGLAIKLKPKYHNFSSALISGGMAIMYFVTYYGYSAYGLISQPAAFALMAMFTAFTVAAALLYNRQVIAHIGLVGAYAVPFLLSSESGNYLFLFSYMTVINAGILAISVKRYWTPIFYTASGLTWLILLGWFATKYSAAEHFPLALTFVGIFAVIFYATKVVHSAVHREHDESESIASASVTALIFYFFTFAVGSTGESMWHFWLLFGVLSVFSGAFLLTSFRYFGRAIVYISFVLTWLTYRYWFDEYYAIGEHTTIATVFAVVFFVMFYAAVLAHRFISDGLTIYENTGLVLANAFLFYGFGYGIIDSYPDARGYLGAFTVAHAGMHFAIANLIGRLRQDSADVVQVLTILILTFISIAVPVQFDGNLVTMIWAVEAALLFWFGRGKGIPLFEYFSLPVMALATGSMFLDWAVAYSDATLTVSDLNRQPLANGDLVTAIVFVAAFGLIYLTDRTRRDASPFPPEIARIFNVGVAVVGTFVLYNAFRIEIGNYFHLRAVGAAEVTEDGSLLRELNSLNIIWQFNYTMGFLAAMAAVNLRKFGSRALAVVSTVLAAFTLFLFASVCLLLFVDLRESYLQAASADPMLIAIRYISYAFAAMLLFVTYRNIRSGLTSDVLDEHQQRLGFEAILCLFTLVIASTELMNLMAQFNIPEGSKLGLSILWGIYSLALIAYGIARNKKHLRIGAIVLLAVTLIKLFFYDVADLDTIPKTILFVTLGITLLIASFLYNKYKSVIAGPESLDETVGP
jgi:hypothetical protein